MSLFVRHSAWLNAIPERLKGDKSEEPVPSRLEKMRRDRKDEDWQPDMPPVEVGEWLLGYLFEIGPTMPAGMGPALISHQEIAAWQALSGVALKPWEARALRLLSAEYLRESREAERRERAAPWNPDEVAPEDLSAVADAMRETMRRKAAL